MSQGKRYLCIGNDSVSAAQLPGLYGVSADQCILVTNDQAKYRQADMSGLIVLRPDPTSIYQLPKVP